MDILACNSSPAPHLGVFLLVFVVALVYWRRGLVESRWVELLVGAGFLVFLVFVLFRAGGMEGLLAAGVVLLFPFGLMTCIFANWVRTDAIIPKFWAIFLGVMLMLIGLFSLTMAIGH